MHGIQRVIQNPKELKSHTPANRKHAVVDSLAPCSLNPLSSIILTRYQAFTHASPSLCLPLQETKRKGRVLFPVQAALPTAQWLGLELPGSGRVAAPICSGSHLLGQLRLLLPVQTYCEHCPASRFGLLHCAGAMLARIECRKWCLSEWRTLVCLLPARASCAC